SFDGFRLVAPRGGPARGDRHRLRQPADVPGEVRVEAHEPDVVGLGLGVVEDEFFDPPELLGRDGLLAQGVEEGPQLGDDGGFGGHARPSWASFFWTHWKRISRSFARALYTASTDRPTCRDADCVVAPSAKRRARRSRSRGVSRSTHAESASRRASS